LCSATVDAEEGALRAAREALEAQAAALGDASRWGAMLAARQAGLGRAHQSLAQAFLDLAALESSCGGAPHAATVAAHGLHAVSNAEADAADAGRRALQPLHEAAAAAPNALAALASREAVRAPDRSAQLCVPPCAVHRSPGACAQLAWRSHEHARTPPPLPSPNANSRS
jgi:hypothetical protein